MSFEDVVTSDRQAEANAIAARWTEQRARIANAAQRAGRDPGAIQLIAVSKTQPAWALRAAYAAGQRDFGENYVQELVTKSEELEDLQDLRFHLIGHLQRNKAKQVAGRVSAIHSVDSVRLVRELGKRALATPVPESRRWDYEQDGALPVFVEVNVSGEPAKSGCSPSDLELVLNAVATEPALRLSGLMTVPPYTADAEQAAPWFEQLQSLREAHGGAQRLPHMSMGMSHDVEVAIAYGATCVRIGTSLFGPRPPKSAR